MIPISVTIGQSSSDCKVIIGDQDVTACLTSVEVTAAVNSLTTVRLCAYLSKLQLALRDARIEIAGPNGEILDLQQH